MLVTLGIEQIITDMRVLYQSFIVKYNNCRCWQGARLAASAVLASLVPSALLGRARASHLLLFFSIILL